VKSLEGAARPADMEPLWTESQAAQYLGVSFKTLQNWRSQGRGPIYYKIGRCARYRRKDLVAFCEQSLVVPMSER
jgi:predicted site-specific integrase-resolvase